MCKYVYYTYIYGDIFVVVDEADNVDRELETNT